MPKFIVKHGAQPGLNIQMPGDKLVFGRTEDCDVMIADANVSRRHAQAVVLDGLVAVVDLNSSNGTFVNELPISRIFLMDGDEVRLGETVLVYSDEGELSRDLAGAPTASSPRLSSAGAANHGPDAGPSSDADQINQTRLFAAIPEDVHADALKETYLKLKALYRVFHEVAQAQSLKDIFEAVARAVTVSVGAERIIFFLNAEKAGGGWERYLTHAAARLDAKAVASPESAEVLERVRDDQRLVLAHVNASRGTLFADKEANTLAIPLLRGGRLAAAIYVDNPQSAAAFTKDDVDFISTLALQVAIRLNQFEQVQQLKQENVQLRQKIDEEYAVVTRNERMRQIMVVTTRVAESDATVLVTGESGTGKELIAQSIHKFSRRRSKPLVAVNCAALPDTLLESELFGHEKGAFTGAVERRIGKFELADGGTLFLDEIGDISASAQAKLLRVLQEGEIQRLGGNKVIKVDVRVIAATNKDLSGEMQKGTFRQDLFFRIKVIEIPLPPLRERKDDIPVLAEYFLKQLRQKLPTTTKSIDPSAMECLMRYEYPGNIRELKNVIERGLVFAHGDSLMPEHLPLEVAAAAAVGMLEGPDSVGIPAGSDPLSLAEVEKRHIQRVLQHVKGNKLKAASLLGISRTTLYEKLKEYDSPAGD
jgi:two-component system response regulator HydG